MRSFKLINGVGNVFDLNSDDSFFYDVEGFGVEKKVDFELVGTFFVEKSEEIKQKEIGGKITFVSYEKYEEFAMFVQNTPLTLEYTSNTTVSIDVKLEKLTKTELEDSGLISQIKLSGLSHFYKNIILQNVKSDSVGKTYPYTYPFTYSDNSAGIVTIDSDSVIESPIKITFIGPCINPSWNHYVNDNMVMQGKVACNIIAGNRLVVDSTCFPYSIKEVDSNGILVEDQYGSSDFSTGRFIHLQKGKNEISFSHEGSDDMQAIVEGKIYYETI